MASTYLSRTPSSAGNRKTFTWSFWFKRQNTGTESALFCVGTNPASDMFMWRFDPDIMNVYAAGNNPNLSTKRKFIDTNAWYHAVLRVDTTQATASDRVRIYINGVQETSFSSATYPAQNYDTNCNTTTTIHIGERADSNQHFGGIMSHVHFCDGYSYAPTEFGETDSTTGEWKIKTSPSVSYGTNGFFILKDGNSVTDSSSNSNNFTVAGGTLTKTEDNPSNVICTMNPLMNYSNGTPTFAQGNTVINGSGSAWLRTSGTLANRTGKFYYEAYLQAYNSNHYKPVRIGWDSIDYPRTGADNYYSGFNISSDGFIRGGIKGVDAYDPNATALGVTLVQGDYIGLAIDLDNDLVTCYKNGTVISNVNGLDISGNSNCSIINSKGYQVTPSLNFYTVNTNDNEIYFNFGNGAFGSTQLTGTTYNDSQGNGVFKYQPPTNYLCWSTKSFNV